MEILYKDYITFYIFGEEYNMISDQTAYGISTVIEIGDLNYYLGEEHPTLENAMFAWQDLHDRDLTLEEFNKVLDDNNIVINEINGE